MTRGRRTWHRRACAATAAVLWLLGVEVLPNLHLATHQHDHTHAVDGSIIQLEHGHDDVEDAHARQDDSAAGDHDHDDYDHHHDHDHAVAHQHHADVDDLALLQVAHEHVVIADDLDFLDHDVAGIAYVAHDTEADLDAEPASEHAETRRPCRHRERTQLAIDQDVAPGHAALGIAHHATALHKPLPPLLAPVATPNVEAWTHAAPNERVLSAELARPTARGPPVA